MSTDKNFTNYRQRWVRIHAECCLFLLTMFRLERAELPCFPYMGTFVTDAVFAWDGKVHLELQL
jgi:hypothetical protein